MRSLQSPGLGMELTQGPVKEENVKNQKRHCDNISRLYCDNIYRLYCDNIYRVYF